MIGLGLPDGLKGLVGVGAHGHLGHVHVTVLHHNLRQGLLADGLARSGKLRHLAQVGGLGRLSAGVGIHLGVKHKDVHVLAGGQHVVQSAVADVVGPAVAAEDPHGLLAQIVLLRQDLRGDGAAVGRGVLQHGDQRLDGLGVGLAVVLGVQILLDNSLILGRTLSVLHHGLQPLDEGVADGLLTQVQAQAVLGVVLEQRVSPGHALAVLVDGVGRGGGGTAPDGGAAGGVGHVHPLAANLGDQAGIGGLGTAGAGAGELQQGLLELAVLDGGGAGHIGLGGHLGHHVVEGGLAHGLLLQGHHGQALGGAHAHTDGAAHAVHSGHGQGVLVHTLALAGLHVHDLGALRSGLSLLLGEGEGTDGGVGADIGAHIALHAGVGVPGGDGHGHAALLIGGGALLEGAVHVGHESGHGQAVAVHAVDGLHHVLDHFHQLGAALQVAGPGLVLGGGPGGGHLELLERGGADVDGLVVHVHDVLALLQVGVGGGVLHVADGLLLGHDLGQLEEGGLEDGVGALAHADLDGQVDGVDGVDLDVVLGDVALGHGGHMLVKLLVGPLAVDEEGAAVLHVPDHGETLDDVGGHVAGHEVGLVDIVGGADGLVAEAQVADGHAAGLLGVVLEVRLDILVGVVADDLDGVLVGAHGAVAAQAPELDLDGALGRGVGGGLLLQGHVGHVVHDADGELALGGGLGQLLIHREHAGGRGVLGAQAVAAADDGDVGAPRVGQGSHHVQVEGLALGAGLLGAVQHGDVLAGGGDSGQQLVRAPGTVQAHLDQTHLLAVGVEVVDDLLGHVADGAHGDDDPVGVGHAVVVEQLVIGAQLGVDLAHVLFHDAGDGVVVLVAGLAVLEEDVAVLMGAAHHGALGVEGAGAEVADGLPVHHPGQVLIVPDGDLLDLVGGTEAVEEVHEGDAALDGGQVGHRAQVHDLLGVGLAQHGEAGLAAGHDVGVVAEDVQRVAGHGPGGHMEYSGKQLAGDLVHIGDHQQQALGGGVSSGQGAGGQGAVDGAGRAGLGLHLNDLDGLAEDILAASGGPLVHVVRHGAGRRDGIDAGHLGKGVGHVGGGGVAVHSFELACHRRFPPFHMRTFTYSVRSVSR